MIVSSNTTIEAVNTILSSIGDSPVNTIEDPTNVNVINAIRELDKVNRQEQARGWSFNVIPAYTLNVDQNTHMISWATTFLRLKSPGTIYTRKGDYVFNFTGQTFYFKNDITVEIIVLVGLEEMPEPMKNYIVAKASYGFQEKYLGDPNLTQGLLADLQEAWVRVQEYETEMNDYNMLTNPEIVGIVRG